MARSCEGLVALVTGASQGGTGTGSAIRLAAEGAKVAICARSEDKLAATLASIEDVGAEGAMFVLDLSDPDGGRDTLVARAEVALGPIDVLVNVAAGGGYARFEEFTLDQVQRAVELNIKTPWLLCQQVLSGMRERARGAIVNIGTKAAAPLAGPPYPDIPPAQAGALYGGTKAALHRFTQSIAAETYGQGISANVLSPLAAIGTPNLLAAGWLPPDVFEPVETMVEAVLALVTSDPNVLTGLDAYSIPLLYELQRPVYDFTGRVLVDGWQPADLPAYIEARSTPVPVDYAGSRGTARDG